MTNSTQHYSKPALLQLDQEKLDSLYQQGKNNQLQGKYDLAIIQLKQFLQANPNHPDALNRLAFCLLTTKRPHIALTTYRQALRLVSNDPAVLTGIANCFKDLGNFDKAISYYEKSLKAEPGKIEALYNLTVIKDYPLNALPVRELEKLHKTLSDTDTSRILVCFALGKIYESNGQHRDAFQYYEEGNRLQFSRSAYNEKDWLDYFDRIENFFNARSLCAVKKRRVSRHDTNLYSWHAPLRQYPCRANTRIAFCGIWR